MSSRFEHYWYRDIREITTLKDMLEGSVRLYGKNPAFWVKQKRGAAYEAITYTLLAHDVDALGTKLWEMGLSGQRIAVMGRGAYEWIASYLAVVNGTGVVVPIDKELTGPEIGNLLRTAECGTIICDQADCGKLAGLDGIRNVIVTEFYGDRLDPSEAPVSRLHPDALAEKVNAGRTDGGAAVYSWRALLAEGEKLLENGDRSFRDAAVDPDGLAVILFTSGTTGNPKGVMLSHRNITVNIMDVCRIAYILESDKTLSILPIHHTYECTLGMLLVLYRGASTAFCEGMKYISQNMKEAQNTVVIVVPRVLEMIYHRVEHGIRKKGKEKAFARIVKLNRGLKSVGIDLSRRIFRQVLNGLGGKLRLVITGAAALSPNVLRMFEDWGITVLQGYGMTECTPLIAGTPMSAKRERYRKAGSVGVPVETGEVKIVDQDESGIGEILYRGPNVMLGYYNMPEETAAVMEPDGWMHTGDLGFQDPQGWLYLTGRKKNVIVTKTGENVYPEEIEDYINESPYIDESMVFPYKDNGEEIVGVQLLPVKEAVAEALGHEPSEEELDRFMEEQISSLNQGLAVYKRIRKVIVRREDFVRTTTRKIRRMDNMDVE